MVTVPAVTPVTVPKPAAATAIALLLLVHKPEGTESVSVTEELTHTAAGPTIAGGKVEIVNDVDTEKEPQALLRL